MPYARKVPLTSPQTALVGTQLSDHSKLNSIKSSRRPVSLARYIHFCNNDSRSGYYHANPAISSAQQSGDFITAPELSSLFTDCLVVWALRQWQALGQPNPVMIVEIGPGNGQMCYDFIKQAASFPKFLQACNFHLIERSPKLQQRQRSKLAKLAVKKTWHTTLGQIPRKSMLLIGNEFLDTMPIQQWLYQDSSWFQIYLRWDQKHQRFQQLQIRQSPPPMLLQSLPAKVPADSLFEFSPWRNYWWRNLVARVLQTHSAAVLLDYGYGPARPGTVNCGSTLQAIGQHRFQSAIITAPGSYDLSSHVDFATLMQLAAAQSPPSLQLSSQREFLCENGLLLRAEQAAKSLSSQRQQQLSQQIQRLIAKEGMGELFRAIEVAAVRS